MRQIDISSAVVQPPLPEADARRLTSWLPEIVVKLRPQAPQQANNGEIRVGNRGSLALYADGGWTDYEADRGGHGAFSFVEYELGDAGKARRFAAEWLSRPGFGSFVPEAISEEAAEARAELFARRATEALEKMLPAERWSSTTPPVSMLNLLARGLPGPYPEGLLGYLGLDDARFSETALIAILTGVDGARLGVQLGYLTLPNGEKSQRIPQRAIFYITLDPEERKTALFRIPGRPRAEGEDAFPDTTFIVEGVEKALAVHMAYPYVPVIGLPGIGRLRRIPPIKNAVIIVRDGDELKSRAEKSLFRGIDHLLLTGTPSVHLTETPLGLDADKIVLENGIEALRELIRTAAPKGLSATGEAEKIAGIRDPLERDEALAKASERLRKERGIRKKTLTAAVEAKRAALRADEEASVDKVDELGPEPWPEPVTDIAAVLNTACAEIDRYVVTSSIVRDTVVLWAVHTFFVHHPWVMLPISPRLGISAVSPICGKTLLLGLVDHLIWHPLQAAGSLTTATLFRIIAQEKPTFAFDELDDLFRAHDKSDLGGILRASHHRRNARVPRMVPMPDGKGWKVEWFPCFGTYVFTLIGRLPAAMQSRVINIVLRRATVAELKVKTRLVRGESAVLRDCGRKIARWAQDRIALPELSKADIPEDISHRDLDNWEPLLRTGLAVGSDWPQRARDGAIILTGKTLAVGDIVPLLTDIFRVLGKRERMSTRQMAAEMLVLDEPSADWNIAYRGQPINDYWLSEHVKEVIRVADEKERRWKEGGKVVRGYRKEHFQDARERYLSNIPLDPDEPSSDVPKKGEKDAPAASADQGGLNQDEQSEQAEGNVASFRATPTPKQPSPPSPVPSYPADSGGFPDNIPMTGGGDSLGDSLEGVTGGSSVAAPLRSHRGEESPKESPPPVTASSTVENLTSSTLNTEIPDAEMKAVTAVTGVEGGMSAGNPQSTSPESTFDPSIQPIVESPSHASEPETLAAPPSTAPSKDETWLPAGDPSSSSSTPPATDVAPGNGILVADDGDDPILAQLRAAENAWLSAGPRTVDRAGFGPNWFAQAGIPADAIEALVAKGALVRCPDRPGYVELTRTVKSPDPNP
jgi:putative DNA primase/helicase